jgi:hypothetical protein
LINENFLLKLRKCKEQIQKDKELSEWHFWIFKNKNIQFQNIDIQEKEKFLKEIIYSNYNLILDQNVKDKIIKSIFEINSKGLDGILLQSYLYLMIGNVTKSDLLLRSFMKKSPFNNWERISISNRWIYNLTYESLSQIFKKISNHPADRRTFHLFCLYLEHFFPLTFGKEESNYCHSKDIKSELSKKIIYSFAPDFAESVEFSSLSIGDKMNYINKLEFDKYQNFLEWNWPYLGEITSIHENFYKFMHGLEEENYLFFSFVLTNPVLIDSYIRKMSKRFMKGRIYSLKKSLNDSKFTMLAIYRLLQEGYVGDDIPEILIHNLKYE